MTGREGVNYTRLSLSPADQASVQRAAGEGVKAGVNVLPETPGQAAGGKRREPSRTAGFVREILGAGVPWREWIIALIGAVVLLVLVMLITGVSVSWAAAGPAMPAATSPAITVVADSPSESFTVQASGTLLVGYPGASTFTPIGSGSPIRATLDASRVPNGGPLDGILSTDGGDQAVTILVLRRSVLVAKAKVQADGWTLVRVAARHWKPSGYVPSNLAPVTVQERVAGVWVPVAKVATGRDGLASVRLPLAPGVHLLRSVRSDGASVSRAVSKTVTVTVHVGC